MAKDRSAEDIISEKEYTMRMKSVSTKPEDDSPGDSESDAGAEFKMGLEYLPDEKNDPTLPDETAEELPEETVTVTEPKSKPPEENVKEPVIKKIPDSAKVVSSEQPAPWMDRDNPSSTN